MGQTLQEEESPVLFTGLGLPSEIAPYIESGSCPWMYLWNPIDLGYLSAYAARTGSATGRITGREGRQPHRRAARAAGGGRRGGRRHRAAAGGPGQVRSGQHRRMEVRLLAARKNGGRGIAALGPGA